MLRSNLSELKFATAHKKIFNPPNPDDMIYYEKDLEWQYTAVADGETVIIIPELIGARIIQIEKEIKPLFKVNYSFNPNNGQVTLLNGFNLKKKESLFILYAITITA